MSWVKIGQISLAYLLLLLFFFSFGPSYLGPNLFLPFSFDPLIWEKYMVWRKMRSWPNTQKLGRSHFWVKLPGPLLLFGDSIYVNRWVSIFCYLNPTATTTITTTKKAKKAKKTHNTKANKNFKIRCTRSVYIFYLQ